MNVQIFRKCDPYIKNEIFKLLWFSKIKNVNKDYHNQLYFNKCLNIKSYFGQSKAFNYRSRNTITRPCRAYIYRLKKTRSGNFIKMQITNCFINGNYKL